MVADALAVFQVSTTKTSTFRGSAITLPAGTRRGGSTCRILYSAASNASGANAVQFSIDLSYDSGSTWQQEFFSDVINLTTTPAAGEIYLLYRVVANVMAVNAVVPQVALSVNITGAGSNPTVTYSGQQVTGGPA